ncbi:MAG TPA: hypothetical protein VFO44_01685 [Steroidobacteraceae bacterium]|nr:hypothetical protein [Steroidobacteraceae bacterium]
MSAGHEDEFETYLRERSVLPGRLTSSERFEPPKDLDAIVLDKARRAIRAPTPMRLYRAPRWALPVALAATILLSFSIVLNISLTTRSSSPQGMIDQAARASAAASVRQQAPPTPSAISSEPMAKKAPQAFTAATGPEAPAAPAPASPGSAGRASAAGAAPEPSVAAARALQAPAERAQAEGGIASKAIPDPATWLRQIEALRAQGKTAEADAELRRFHQAFPDYPSSRLPPALRDPAK